MITRLSVFLNFSLSFLNFERHASHTNMLDFVFCPQIASSTADWSVVLHSFFEAVIKHRFGVDNHVVSCRKVVLLI